MNLSLGMLCTAIVVLFVVGIVGGYIGARIAPVPLTVLEDGSKTIIPVSQHITVSPSKIGEDVVVTQGKSVVLLVHQKNKETVPLGRGIILTNDGIVASTERFPDTPLAAVLEDGSVAPLTFIAHDILLGITFFRIPDQILPPVTLAQSAPKVGAEMLSIIRDERTMHVASGRHTLSAIVAPDGKHASGVQQVGILSGSSPVLPGMVLFNDNGALVGVMNGEDTPTMLLLPDITAALSRLSSNTLAQDPFSDIGITIVWKTQQDRSGVFGVRAVVSSVAPKTRAFDAGVKSGDILKQINGSAVTWDSPVWQLLTKPPSTLLLLRQDEERTVTLP